MSLRLRFPEAEPETKIRSTELLRGSFSVKKKNLSVMKEIWVQSLGREDPLEKGMATHSSILAWRIPWTEEPAWRTTVHRVTKSQIPLSDSHKNNLCR